MEIHPEQTAVSIVCRRKQLKAPLLVGRQLLRDTDFSYGQPPTKAKRSVRAEDIASLVEFSFAEKTPWIIAATGIFLLAGCHADVTFRFDVRGNGTVLVSAREVLDDQLYRLALSQSQSDPLKTNQLSKEGWSISRADDDGGNHIITLSKAFGPGAFRVNGRLADSRVGSLLPFTSIKVIRAGGIFSEQDSLTAVTPALLPWAESKLTRSYAAVVDAMSASLLAVHLELRTPGKILATNGAVTHDGFVRWDLNLQAPTHISYSVRVVRYDRIVLVVVTTLMLLVIAARLLQLKLRNSAVRVL